MLPRYLALPPLQRVHGRRLNRIQPRNDRILVRRIEQPEQMIGRFVIPDVARQKGILGEVVAVGPGKWVPGEWWKCSDQTPPKDWRRWQTGDYDLDGNGNIWEWIPGYRQAPSVQPKQTVYFNSRWNDVEQLPGGMHLIQEADIFCIVPANARPATASSPDLPPLVQSIDPFVHA